MQSFNYFIFLSSTEGSMSGLPATSWLLDMEYCWVPELVLSVLACL